MTSGVQSGVNSLNPVGGEITRTSVFLNWAKTFILSFSKNFSLTSQLFFIKFKNISSQLFKGSTYLATFLLTNIHKGIVWLSQPRVQQPPPDHIRLSTSAPTKTPEPCRTDTFDLAKWRASLVEVANKPMEHKHVAIDIPPKGDGHIIPRNTIATLPHGVLLTWRQ